MPQPSGKRQAKLARSHLSAVIGVCAIGSSLLLQPSGCERKDVAETPSPASGDWRIVAEDALTEQQRGLVERAAEARQAMAGALMSRLLTTMEADGAAAAIEICAVEAPAIAERIGREHGLQIGRTAHRLRNPANQPPDWAVPLVEHRVEESRVLAGPGGRVGVWSPIHVAGPCLSCHGPSDALAPGVAEVLSQRYPADQATGFAEGELRGGFWVELGEE